MANENRLSRRIRAFGADLPENANAVKQAFAKEVLTQIVSTTPVKTGKTRSNWNTSLGGPNYSIRETQGRSGDAAIQRGVAVIRGAKPSVGIHIANGMPNIERLNSGWSKQAPSGYIDRAIASARSLLKRIRFSTAKRFAP